MGTKCFRQFFQMPGYDHDMNWNAHFATEIIYFRTVNVSLTKAVRHLTWLLDLWTSAILSIYIFGCFVDLSAMQMLNNSSDWLQTWLTSWLTGTTCNQTHPADWLSKQTDRQQNDCLNEWANARICPQYELICTSEKLENLLSQTSRFIYKRPINRPQIQHAGGIMKKLFQQPLQSSRAGGDDTDGWLNRRKDRWLSELPNVCM